MIKREINEKFSNEEIEVVVLGKADSRVAKRHLGDLLWAIEDCLFFEEINKNQENNINE